MRTPPAFARIGAERRFVAGSASLSLAILAAVVVAAAEPAAGADILGAAPTGTTRDQERTVGLFTGKFVNGMPLYRLPPISVSASRKTELAKTEREERLTRAGQAKARIVTRPPA